MLKIQFTDNRQPAFWIMNKDFSIGRSKNNQLVIHSPLIADEHAKIVQQGNTFLLRDLSDDHSTLLNGQPVSEHSVSCGDTISIGDAELCIVDPLEESANDELPYWSLIGDSSWLSGQEFPIISKTNERVVVGRDPSCDLVIAGTHLSRQHAEITINKDSLIVKDLNSANGTFFNEKKVTKQVLKPGDRIRFDVYCFKVFGPGIDLPSAATAINHRSSSPPPKSPQETPKQWKTPSTSPGNRTDETQGQQKSLVPWLTALLVITLLGVTAHLIINGSGLLV